MEKIYKAAKGARFTDEEAKKIGPVLEQIEQKFGSLRPEDILTEAQKKKSYLHRFFDWSDSEAALKWRKHQARQLVSHVRIVIIDDDGQTRKAWENVRVKIEPESEEEIEDRRYVSYEQIDANEFFRGQVVQRGLKELETWLDKYRHYEEMKSLVSSIEREMRKMQKEYKLAA